MSNFNFKPWIGPYYECSEMKMLVIGDSPYCGECERCGVRGDCTKEEMEGCYHYTINTVNDYIKARHGLQRWGKWMSCTYLKFDKIIYGIDDVSIEQTEKLWNSIAFFNFIQSAASPNPNNKNYKAEDYDKSRPIVAKLIEQLMPNIIIVWGRKAYEALSEANWHTGSDYYNGYYEFENGHKIYCLDIFHPRCAKPAVWHKKIENFLTQDCQYALECITSVH